jgi:hypothetical protein
MDHLKITYKMPEQHAREALNCGTAENSHIKTYPANVENRVSS